MIRQQFTIFDIQKEAPEGEFNTFVTQGDPGGKTARASRLLA